MVCVGFVEHQQLRHPIGGNFTEHFAHCFDLAEWVDSARIHNVQQQVAAGGNFERALERLNQRVRQSTNETHRVGEQHRFATRQRKPTRGRIQRGKQPVFYEHPSRGQPIEQGRLACVGVTHDGHVG